MVGRGPQNLRALNTNANFSFSPCICWLEDWNWAAVGARNRLICLAELIDVEAEHHVEGNELGLRDKARGAKI